MTTALAALAVLLSLMTLPGTLELLLLTVGAWLPLRHSRAGDDAAVTAVRLVAVIPAHDEQGTIARTVASLRASAPDLPVVVVADNCSDATADRARAAGARVLVRRDEERRGKPFALDFAFGVLLPEGHDAVAVVDADTVVSPGFVPAARAALVAGASAVQAPYGVLDPHASLRATLQNVAFMAFNHLRPRGRAGWGWSVGILGNGFALRRRVLEAVPLRTRSITEDLHYHLDLVEAGWRVDLLPETEVRAEMPHGGAGARSQRARWEGGRLQLARTRVPGLMARVVRGELRLLEPLLDLLTLPLALHVLLLGAALLLPGQATRIAAAAGLAVVLLHVGAALVIGRAGVREILVLLLVPAYVFWKILQLPATVRASRRGADWVRTERPPSD